jgi:hypothetical protein
VGTVTFAVSPDGFNWTVLGTTPTPTWNITNLVLNISCGDGNTAPGPYTVLVDAVNPLAQPVTTNWARLSGPEGDRPGITYFTNLISAPLILTTPHQRYDTSWTDPVVRRTWQGLCFLEGLVRRSDNASVAGGTVIGYVPEGFWPTGRTILNGVCNGTVNENYARMDLDPNGALTLQVASSAVWFSVTGCWYTDQTWHR